MARDRDSSILPLVICINRQKKRVFVGWYGWLAAVLVVESNLVSNLVSNLPVGVKKKISDYFSLKCFLSFMGRLSTGLIIL